MICNKILVLSDVHLGHRRTKAIHIIENLQKILNPKRFAKIDLLIIAGDLFDRALGYCDDDILEIQKWLILLLSSCREYNITLRVLEGTPLHDRKQSRHLGIFNKAINYDVDFLYIDKVFIEKNEKHNLNILYIPDEWHPDPDETWIDVKQCLAENNLDMVDISVMHGMFEHQIPKMAKIKPHINSRYESITDKYIFIGHVHQSSKNNKIIAPGSFDRLKHSEEEKKGCWYVEINNNRSLDKIQFIENKNALDYLTVNCQGLGFDSSIEKISALKLQSGSHIRIKALNTDNALAILEWCKKTFHNYHWSLKVMNAIEEDKFKETIICRSQGFSINSNSIYDLLEKKMLDNGLSRDVIDNALKLGRELF